MEEVCPLRCCTSTTSPQPYSSYSSREWRGLHNQQNFYFTKNKCTASLNHLNFINNEMLLEPSDHK